MSRSAVLDKANLTLEDLDAFVDESLDAMDEQEFEAYKAAVSRIMLDSKQPVADLAVPRSIKSDLSR